MLFQGLALALVVQIDIRLLDSGQETGWRSGSSQFGGDGEEGEEDGRLGGKHVVIW